MKICFAALQSLCDERHFPMKTDRIELLGLRVKVDCCGSRGFAFSWLVPLGVSLSDTGFLGVPSDRILTECNKWKRHTTKGR